MYTEKLDAYSGFDGNLDHNKRINLIVTLVSHTYDFETSLSVFQGLAKAMRNRDPIFTVMIDERSVVLNINNISCLEATNA